MYIMRWKIKYLKQKNKWGGFSLKAATTMDL